MAALPEQVEHRGTVKIQLIIMLVAMEEEAAHQAHCLPAEALEATQVREAEAAVQLLVRPAQAVTEVMDTYASLHSFKDTPCQSNFY